MNSKEIKNQKQFKNWTDVIPTVRTQLNEIRERDPELLVQKLVQTTTYVKNKDGKGKYVFKKPKYKVGDTVYRLLENPENALGHVQFGKAREGDYRVDRTPRKISEVVEINGPGPLFRYILEGIKGVSYKDSDLRKRL
jgi:hypothetical protein